MAEGKKNRKIGRNIDACRRYAATHRCEHNQLRRLKKHLKRFADDLCAVAAVDRCKAIIGMK
jgi:hypothetical protein